MLVFPASPDVCLALLLGAFQSAYASGTEGPQTAQMGASLIHAMPSFALARVHDDPMYASESYGRIFRSLRVGVALPETDATIEAVASAIAAVGTPTLKSVVDAYCRRYESINTSAVGRRHYEWLLAEQERRSIGFSVDLCAEWDRCNLVLEACFDLPGSEGRFRRTGSTGGRLELQRRQGYTLTAFPMGGSAAVLQEYIDRGLVRRKVRPSHILDQTLRRASPFHDRV